MTPVDAALFQSLGSDFTLILLIHPFSAGYPGSVDVGIRCFPAPPGEIQAVLGSDGICELLTGSGPKTP